jgi:hypothetical protein
MATSYRPRRFNDTHNITLYRNRACVVFHHQFSLQNYSLLMIQKMLVNVFILNLIVISIITIQICIYL